jgi:hypothetical protein
MPSTTLTGYCALIGKFASSSLINYAWCCRASVGLLSQLMNFARVNAVECSYQGVLQKNKFPACAMFCLSKVSRVS